MSAKAGRRSAYLTAEEKYQGIRDAVYEVTWDIWSQRLAGQQIDLRLLPVDINAIRFEEAIWRFCPSPGSDGGFNWRNIYQNIRKTPRRFELAIWNGPILCGLVAGMASRGADGPDTNVTVWYLERAGDEINELKRCVAGISLDAAIYYARALERKMVYLKEPVPGARPRYEAAGFTLASRQCKGTYYGRAVWPDDPDDLDESDEP